MTDFNLRRISSGLSSQKMAKARWRRAVGIPSQSMPAARHTQSCRAIRLFPSPPLP